MAFDFPASPTIGAIFSSGGISYTWNGVGWVRSYTPTSPGELVPVPPTTADFATIVDATANSSAGVASDNAYGITLTKNSNNINNTNQWFMRLRTLPTLTQNRTMTACIRKRTALKKWRWHAIVLRESSTGKLVTIGPTPDGSTYDIFAISRWTGDGSAQGANVYTDYSTMGFKGKLWFRVRWDNTNNLLIYEMSYEGLYWFSLTQEAKTISFTTAPNQWGFGINSNGVDGVTYPAICDCLHWSET